MATVYITPPPIGDDSRSYAQAQDPATPWATVERAIAAATAGDTAILASGSYRAPASPGYHNFTKRLLCQAVVAGLVTFYADTAFATYTARTGAAANAGPISMTGILFDGELRVATGYEIGVNDTADWTSSFTDAVFMDVTTRGINVLARRGTVNVTDCLLTGTLTNGSGIVSGNNDLGVIAAAPFAFNASGVTFGLTAATDAPVFGINLGASLTRLSAVTYTITNLGGQITAHSSNAAVGCRVLGGDNAQVLGSADYTLTINGTSTVDESIGVQVYGRNATATADAAAIAGVNIRFNAPAGHGISLGQSTVDSFMTGGSVLNCYVQGTYYATATPHGITLGQVTSGEAVGNVSEELYVGFLISKTTTASVRGNIAKDCYGPSFYAKGTVAATIDSNTAQLSGKNTQRDLGVLAATYQGAVDCTAVTFSGNTVIVADISKIHALASLSGLAANSAVPQPATFTNNIYIIPDTVDLTTELLFVYTGVLGAAANQTYAQWIANVEVTGDRVVQLPQSVINSMVLGEVPGDAIFHNGVWYNRDGTPLYGECQSPTLG